MVWAEHGDALSQETSCCGLLSVGKPRTQLLTPHTGEIESCAIFTSFDLFPTSLARKWPHKRCRSPNKAACMRMTLKIVCSSENLRAIRSIWL